MSSWGKRAKKNLYGSHLLAGLRNYSSTTELSLHGETRGSAKMLGQRLIRVAVAMVPIVSMTAVPEQSLAAAADVSLLQSYVGDYVGSGTLSGTGKPEAVKCRLSLRSPGNGSVTYTGRCSAVSANFSMAGIFAFVGNHYEAAMSSSSGQTVTVVGQKRSGGIVFRSSQKESEGGQNSTISSSLALLGGSISIEFKVQDNATGETSSGAIPFARR
jgi:hypothetical protein